MRRAGNRSEAYSGRMRRALAAALTGLCLLLTTPPSKGDTPDPVMCGSIDLVFVIDTTYSLATAIGEMKRESLRIIDLVETLSNGQYRLGLVTFDDAVKVVLDLNDYPSPRAKADILRQAILSLRTKGGGAGPEASDEAVNTAVNRLAADRRDQTGDFTGEWQAHSRIIVLITDNLPGGFDDVFEDGVDDRRAMGYASDALGRNVRISVIHVPTSGLSGQPDPKTAGVLRGYAIITGGLYAETRWAGSGTAEAVMTILKACGANPLS